MDRTRLDFPMPAGPEIEMTSALPCGFRYLVEAVRRISEPLSVTGAEVAVTADPVKLLLSASDMTEAEPLPRQLAASCDSLLSSARRGRA